MADSLTYFSNDGYNDWLIHWQTRRFQMAETLADSLTVLLISHLSYLLTDFNKLPYHEVLCLLINIEAQFHTDF